MLCLKSTGELGSSGCEGGNDDAVGCCCCCGWTKDEEDIGEGKIKLRLLCEFDCCICVSLHKSDLCSRLRVAEMESKIVYFTANFVKRTNEEAYIG